ncbi:hypothetical protein SANTM175S_02607 [Streptomyces antimycoticus]
MGLYRRLLAGRRALVVIDHASSAAQVRALVPATPDVFLLVVASGPALALEAERIEVPRAVAGSHGGRGSGCQQRGGRGLGETHQP